MPLNRFRHLDCYALVYVHRGQGTFKDESGLRHSVRAGDFFVLFPGYGHSYGSQEGWDEIFVIFDGPIFALLEQHGVIQRQRPLWRLEPTHYWLGRFRQAITPAKDDAASALERLGRLAGFILETVEARDSDDDPEQLWLRRARREIESSLSETTDLPAVASRMGVSYETFRKRFSLLSGESPGRYRDQRLHERAANLLRKTSLSVAEIAEQLNYCDAFHFSKQFKKHTGLSPRDFRNQFWRPDSSGDAQ